MEEQISSVPFKYRVGEITLATIVRRMVVRPQDPFVEKAGATFVELTIDGLPRSTDGLLLRSAPVKERLPRVRLQSYWIEYVPRQYERYFVDLRSSHEEYLKSFSRKSRSSLRRKVRRFEQESGGSISWKRYATPREIEDFHQLAREVSRDTYQERLLDAGLPADDGFRQGVIRAAEEGNVRGYLIFLERRAVAYLFCPIRDGIVQYSYLGYRPEYESLSPGTVLLWLVIEDLLKEGKHRIFDFTEGADASSHSQKRLFSTSSVSCADVYLLRRTFFNLFVVLTHTTVEGIVEHTGLLMERVGLKRTVKRLARRLWPPRSKATLPADESE
jgi:CelD/BcsL family acetyltransferase involved in cellulose biosynthesis